MSGLILIVGIGIVTFLILFLMFIMKDDPKQFLLRLLLLFFAVVFLLLIAKTTLDNENYCDVVINETIIINDSITTYDYNRVCFDNPNMTTNIFYKFVNRFQYIIYIYMIMYLIYEVLVWRGLLPEGLIKGGKKKP